MDKLFKYQLFTELHSVEAPRRKGLCPQEAMSLLRKLDLSISAHLRVNNTRVQDNKERACMQLIAGKVMANRENFLSRKQLFEER